MIQHVDHVTLVVRDAEKAKEFFRLLGFEEEKSVVISGNKFSRYMGIDGIEAEHCTLVLAGSSPRLEIQLLTYGHPEALPDPNVSTLRELGYNHICFAVDDIESELKRLTAGGIEAKNEIMEFNDRKLVFLDGPEGITVELAEWV